MLKTKLLEDLKMAVEDLGFSSDDLLLYIPKNLDFGDYTTNVALQLAKQKSAKAKQSPEMIANKIATRIKSLESSKEYLEKVEVAGGFINFFLKTEKLLENLHQVCNYSLLVNPEMKMETSQEKKIFMEYAQPNTHKEFHMGHTRNIILGESISRLFEAQGNKVFRSTYGSDIGLPVAKAIWGIKQLPKQYQTAKKGTLKEKSSFLGKAYVKGAIAYDEDEHAKKEINQLNKAIYERDPKIMKLWQETRQWSLDYFDELYTILGTKFDRVFHESEVEADGKKMVMDNVGKVFIEDQGAIIFPGEKCGLHNRVFVTAAGFPTYDAKDLRLAMLKEEIWPYDLAVILSGSEQKEYFQVMFKALGLIDDKFKDKVINYPFGTANFSTGKKMSSRKGEVITFDYLFSEVKKAVVEIMKGSSEVKGEERELVIAAVALGAIKFSMLKFAASTNIIFDLKTSISLSGDSGPYVQYTYARAKSVLRTASFNYQPEMELKMDGLEPEERSLLQKLEHFDSFVSEAAQNLAPNILAEFLLNLAKDFNLFYQKHPIIKASEGKVEFRLALTCAVAVVLKQGLYLLGIEAPEQM